MGPFLPALVLLAAEMPSAPAQPSIHWSDATEFEIEGRGWVDAAAPYVRFPARAQSTVPQTVWHLSHHSAGLCVRFVTDAPSVAVKWSLLSTNLDMPHMPSSGASGVDLYVRDPHLGWRFRGNGIPSGQQNEATLSTGVSSGSSLECRLYLPLYNGVSTVKIGVAEGKTLAKARSRTRSRMTPIVVYGTSIVQGGCASRPGTAWPAILGRMLDRPVINLGFMGSGLMEPELSALLAELSPEVFVIDCLWNMALLTEPEIDRRIGVLIATIRKAHKETPIVFVGQSCPYPEVHPTKWTKCQAAAVRKARESGVRGLVLIDGVKLMGTDGEGTVDGCHPTDLGMLRQAEVLRPIIARLLANRNRASAL
jgi:hypothetical protein